MKKLIRRIVIAVSALCLTLVAGWSAERLLNPIGVVKVSPGFMAIRMKDGLEMGEIVSERREIKTGRVLTYEVRLSDQSMTETGKEDVLVEQK